MNSQQIDKKTRRDATKIMKDLNTLSENTSPRFGRLGRIITRAAHKTGKELLTEVDHGSSQIRKGLDELTSDTKAAVENAAGTVKMDIAEGSKRYNIRAQKLANKLPGNIGKMAVRYPWMTVSIALLLGLFLGGLLKYILSPRELHQV
jgi:ElaB/YqjD/DUF883 family membrane-anchored ribosome-binding protein